MKKRSLYDEALVRFKKSALEHHDSPKDKELLNEFLKERAFPEEARKAAEALKRDAGKKYGSKKAGDVEIPESWISNIMGNIELFIKAGDFALSNAPETVGMAWFAVKITLNAIQSNYDLYAFFGSGLSDVSEVMIIVRHYDRLYDERHKPNWKPSPLVEKLFEDVIAAYVAVLEFSYAIKRHLTAGTLSRIKHGIKDFFGLSKIKFEDKLNAVTEAKKKILEETQGAFQDKTLSQLQSATTVLSQIKDCVKHIQDFQETERRLREEANAKFDSILKGLDEIKASTKVKSRWDYAVQDFQTFQESLDPLSGCFRMLYQTLENIYPGTCEWIFNEPLIVDWLAIDVDNPDEDILVIRGPEGSGKSYLAAAIADRVMQTSSNDSAILYVSCSDMTRGTGRDNPEQVTADRIAHTALHQLYNLAKHDEDTVETLEACNAIFRKAKKEHEKLPPHMRDKSTGLPDFGDAMVQIANLLDRDVFLIIDGVDRNSLGDNDQGELLRKIQDLRDEFSEYGEVSLRVLVTCSNQAKFFHHLDMTSQSWIDVSQGNHRDIEHVLTQALEQIPGLTSAEKEEAIGVIMEKARSRFTYVVNTAIPFMREPFRRPLSARLKALPDDINDIYAKALSMMSPNYLELLRTALTWCLLAPSSPQGWPQAKEIMDSFQGIYDSPTDDGILATESEDLEEDGFPPIEKIEFEQLLNAKGPFLRVLEEDPFWVDLVDKQSLEEFFVKPGLESQHEVEHHANEELLCARCKALQSSSTSITIDPKQAHLQMALTCLRHLNNPVFQRRLGLAPVFSSRHDGQAQAEPIEEDNPSAAPETQGADPAPTKEQSERPTETGFVEAFDNLYAAEDSEDDEDKTGNPFGEEQPDEDEDSDPYVREAGPASTDCSSRRRRYEFEYWQYHVRAAEKLWPAEERAGNSTWAALMEELDRFAFQTPQFFGAWQQTRPRLRAFPGGPHPPLFVASAIGLISWVEHLLDRGEDMNELSGGYSPLQAATFDQDGFPIIKLFVQKGADINAFHGGGWNTVHLWFRAHVVTPDEARFLLEHGADPRIASSYEEEHWTALHYFAISGEDPEVVDLLVAHGADINAVHPEDPTAFSPLHLLLMRPKDIPPALLKTFIKHGCDTNYENALSARPLQIVCTQDRFEELKLLLELDVVDINDQDLHGTTALDEAIDAGYIKCASLLLERGANPDITDKLGRTPLHTAAMKGNAEAVKLLLPYSRDPNQADDHGWTPFLMACLAKNEQCASLLLDTLIERKVPLAEINKPSRTNRTPLRQAASRGFSNVVSKLLRVAEEKNDPDALPIDAVDTRKGMGALHRAAMGGHAACVRALLAANPKPDVSIRDKQAKTALMLAYEQWAIANDNPSYEEIVSLLIDADTSAAIQDPELVAVCATNGSTELLKKLWRLNADLNRPDRFGWTPLELARHFGRDDAEAFLKQQATWAKLLPNKWSFVFPGTTALGARSIHGSDGLSILHTSHKRVCISADKPIPPTLDKYYFEVTLKPISEDIIPLSFQPRHPEFAIGFCTVGGAAIRFPGWAREYRTPPIPGSVAESWGYMGDDGSVWASHSSVTYDADEPEEWRISVGDTVGAGVDLVEGVVWFTKNGAKVDRVLEGVTGLGRLWPVVGLYDPVSLAANFGNGSGEEFVWKGEVEEEEEEDEGSDGDDEDADGEEDEDEDEED